MTESSWQKKKVTKILQSLAAAYLANRQYENAVEKFLQLKNLGDDDPSTCLGLAGAFLGLKKTTPDALHAYRQFCDYFPEDGDLISNIAELLLHHQVRSDEALHIYRCAIAFHPPFEKDLHVLLLDALEHSGDIPLALQAARSAALLPGSDTYAIKKLVSLSWRQKRFDELVQELKMLAEQPALASEIRLYMALTLAYRALHNHATLPSREAKTVKQAALSLLPIKSILCARNYCTLQLALAQSERRQEILVEEQAAASAKVAAGDQANYFTDSSGADLEKNNSSHVLGAFVRQTAGSMDNLEAETDAAAFFGQARAIMVVALHSPVPLTSDYSLPHARAGVDHSLQTLCSSLQAHTKHIRRFDDGLIAVAESTHQLVESAAISLRRLSKNDAAAQQASIPPSIIIHALADDVADGSVQTLALLTTVLQLTTTIPQQAGGRHHASPRAGLYMTGEALAALKNTHKLVVTNQRKVPVGVLTRDLEIGEIIWQDPFDLAQDNRPIQVGRFVVLDKIRSSETATTFLARDHKLGVTAILKSLSPRRAVQVDEEELIRAIRRIGKLTHPGLALIHDMGKREGIFYFIREFVEGHSLAKEESFDAAPSTSKILNLGLQACRALQHAHREGVLHLNLKPSNCWITPEGKIKLTDFAMPGIYAASADLSNSSDGNNYIAPEVRESLISSPASDVYSLAALLFLMISHLPTNAAPDDDFFESLGILPDQRIPEPLKEVLFSAVAHDPLARPQSMLEFERQLRHCLSQLPPPAM